MTKDKALNIFRLHYGEPTHQVFAPGRANIIGEHTDYNDGFVLPFSIGQGIWFLASANGSSHLDLMAADTGEHSMIPLDGVDHELAFGWERYFVQVLKALGKPLKYGLNMVFCGNLPIGGGVSSSSAITCGFISILNHFYHLDLSGDDMLELAVTAETGTGVRGGIMDQFTIFNGKKGEAILLDCRSCSHEYVELDMKCHHFYLINTHVRHNLVQTDYNSRRGQCEVAKSLISDNYKKIEALRDLDIRDLPDLQEMLDDTLFKRVSFVVQENNRVLRAVKTLKAHDWNVLGEVLYESHDELSNMYEVSCDELDWLVEYTLDNDLFLGARMMGGGFGGCTINLTREKISSDISADIENRYYKQFGIKPEILEINSENGILNSK